MHHLIRFGAAARASARQEAGSRSEGGIAGRSTAAGGAGGGPRSRGAIVPPSISGPRSRATTECDTPFEEQPLDGATSPSATAQRRLSLAPGEQQPTTAAPAEGHQEQVEQDGGDDTSEAGELGSTPERRRAEPGASSSTAPWSMRSMPWPAAVTVTL